MADITIPQDLWDDDKEGVIVSWLYVDGAAVAQGKLIAEVMVEKSQLELNSPASGKLKILSPAETVVRKGDVIGRIEPA
jgi:pyruvate/2-oxoglutarate dehydrogenase complex dihydrolipoamide acyltransferase (E2) component